MENSGNQRRLSLIHRMALSFDEKSFEEKNLDDFLASPALVGFLEHFAAKCFCDENLRFFHSVGWWINKYDSQSLAETTSEAKAIFDEFIATNSPTEISVSSKARDGVVKALAETTIVETAFEPAIREAYQTLHRKITSFCVSCAVSNDLPTKSFQNFPE